MKSAYVKWGKIFTLVLFLNFTIRLLSLDVSKGIKQYKIDSWRSSQGLDQNSVFALSFLKNGYLWIGTNEGLLSFDGHRFYSLSYKLDSDNIGMQRIQAIYQDRREDVWIGTKAGLYRLKKKTGADFFVKEQIAVVSIDCICETKDGTIWACGEKGIIRIKNNQIIQDNLLMDFLKYRVRSILEDSHGIIWIATDGEGLYCVENQKIIHFGKKDGLSSDYTYSLLEDKKGTLWIGTKNRVNRIRNGKIENFLIDKNFSETLHIMCLHQDRSGNLWLGTEKGLYRFTEGKVERLCKDDGLPGDFIRCIAEDAEGNLWIGTIDESLFQISDEKITMFSKNVGLSDDLTSSVIKDDSGRILIGTQGGISIIDKNNYGYFKKENILENNYVLCIKKDNKGLIYIGTKSGIYVYKDGRITKSPISDKPVNAILCDSKDNIWVGTIDGLYLSRNGIGGNADAIKSLSNNFVNCIFEDSSGTIWIGTQRGINIIQLSNSQPGKYSVTILEKAKALYTNAIYMCKNSLMWIGTREGLKLYDKDKLYSFTTSEGLYNYSVETILEDDKNNLWLGTKGGIVKVAKDELIRMAESGKGLIHPVLYTERDGMHNRLCNGPGAVTGEGENLRLWFPTISGLALIEPNRIKINRVPPPVYVEEMTVDGDLFPLADRQESASAAIGPGVRRIEFRFTALSFLQPERVRFKYKLEGYDKEWSENDSSRRFATYTNIPPGKYNFLVTACNNDSIWNEKGDVLSFYLKPFIYQRPIFYILVCIFTLTAVYLFITYRTRSLEGRRRELEQRVREKTRELAGANQELQNLNEQISRANTDLETINDQLRLEINEKELAQEALRESNEKLKELDRLKTEFLNTVSHELRTPLTSVVGFAKMIRRKQEEITPLVQNGDSKIERSISQVKKDIDIIIVEGERLTAMINDLLDIAKLESGKSVWNMKRLEVREIIQNAVAFTASLFEQKALQRRIDIEENLPAVIGDRDRLIQVLINLLSNAVKFTDAGLVTCRACLVKEQASGSSEAFIEVSVADTGIGIAEEHHEKLFDKFIQVREGRNAFMKGTGLGLSICKQIVEHHGGRIWVKSGEGRGSIFHFTLPVAK